MTGRGTYGECSGCRMCSVWDSVKDKPPKQEKASEVLTTKNVTHEDLRAMTEVGSALETLGYSSIPEGSKRDAIHVAVFPAVASERLFPGQHVGLVDGSETEVTSKAAKLVGVVDPFVEGTIFPGSRFWVLLYPRTITGLRHEWTHPDFSEVPKAETSAVASAAVYDMMEMAEIEKIKKAAVQEYIDSKVGKPDPTGDAEYDAAVTNIADYASQIGVEYEDLMYHALDHYQHGEYWSEGSRFEGEYPPTDFWDWFEIVKKKDDPACLERKSTWFNRGGFFSCSC